MQTLVRERTARPDPVAALRLARLAAKRRLRFVTAGLLVVTLAAFAVSVSVGDFPIPLSDIAAGMLGDGPADVDFVLRTLRLPRAITAALVGCALGLSGSVFQSLTRNPLASPDIIGITAGAGFAAVFTVVIVGSPDQAALSLASLSGALGTATVIYLLAYRQGLSPYRLVLVGIGIAAILAAGTSYLLTRAEILDAQRAMVWLTGSVNGRSWNHVVPLGLALAVLAPITLWLTKSLQALQLGDDKAAALGTHVEKTRVLLLVAAVSLAAVATASAGPVAFVAFVAPPIARRLTDRPVTMVPAALTGASLMILADIVGRRAFLPTELPVGVITAIVGAPYLLWLLARANRIGGTG